MAARLISLFPDQESEQEKSISWSTRLSQLLAKRKDSLATSFFLSLLFHLVLILFFSSIDVSPSGFSAISSEQLSEPSRLKEENLVAFNLALNELLQDEKKQKSLTTFMDKMNETEIPEVVDDFILIDRNMSQKERVEFFKQLIEKTILEQADHQETLSEALTANKADRQPPTKLELNSGDRIFLEPSLMGENKYEVFVLRKDIALALEGMKEAGLIKEKPAFITKETIQLVVQDEKVEIPAEYFYRPCPYEKIMARGAGLFTAVKGFDRLKAIDRVSGSAPVSDRAEKESEKEKSSENQNQNFRVIYYGEIWPEEKTLEKSLKPVSKKFTLPREKWEGILDSLMAYPDEEQFRKFEAEFLQKYDPDDPALAEFVREFVNSNINGAIFLYQPFQAAFDSLEELYYKSPIFERLLFYVNRAPDSLLATEILFCLASALDFERRTIAYLSKAYPAASVCLQRKYDLDYVFNSQAKALTIKTVYDELKRFLAAAGFSSVDDALYRYTHEIIRIYSYLAEKGGEAGDRARFALGCFLWEQGDKREATRVWEKISLTFKTQPFPRIRGILYNPKFSVIEENVDKILDYESRRYTYYLHQRAIKFHKWLRRESNQRT